VNSYHRPSSLGHIALVNATPASERARMRSTERRRGKDGGANDEESQRSNERVSRMDEKIHATCVRRCWSR